MSVGSYSDSDDDSSSAGGRSTSICWILVKVCSGSLISGFISLYLALDLIPLAATMAVASAIAVLILPGGKSGKKKSEATIGDFSEDGSGSDGEGKKVLAPSSQNKRDTHLRFLNTSKPSPTQKRVKFLIKWCDLKLGSLAENDYPGTIQLMDDVVSEFSLVVEATKNTSLESERQKLVAFVKFVEKTMVYKRYQKANNVWLKHWGEGGGKRVQDEDAWLRYQFVFPTIINVAKILAVTNTDRERITTSEYQQAVKSGKVVKNAINFLADWCYQVLQTKQVRAFLAAHEKKKMAAPSSSPGPGDNDYEHPPDGVEEEMSDVENVVAGSLCEEKNESGGASPFRKARTAEAESIKRSRSGSGSSAAKAGGFGSGSQAMSPNDNPSIHSKTFPCLRNPDGYNGQTHKWALGAPPPKIRGPNYLVDKVKIAAGPAYLDLIGVDLYTTKEDCKCYSEKAKSFVQQFRKLGEKRFLFVVNFRFPPHQFCSVYALPKDTSRVPKLFTDFVQNMSTKERHSRFKVVPSVVDGPWIVKTAVGNAPAIIAKALETTYYEKKDDWFEVSCNVYSSTTAKYILKVVSGASRKLAMDVGFVIESQSKAELPETFMGGCRIVRCDLNKARKMD